MVAYEQPTVLDLFSGIGGFSLAFESVGFRTIGFAEIEPYACAVLRKHWPDVPNFGDIRNVNGKLAGQVAVITAGFPCQPFSVAGKKRGARDERFLWPELVRVIGAVRPAYCLLENVPGLLSNDEGKTFRRILGQVAALGYDCIWNCVPASAVGAPHQRDRVWIVAADTVQLQRRQRCEPSMLRGWQAEAEQAGLGSGSADVANSSSIGRSEDGPRQPEPHSQNLADASCSGREELHASTISDGARHSAWGFVADGSHWATEPNVGRVAHGVPQRVDRLRCLGNGIVPQVAQIFAKEIYKALTFSRSAAHGAAGDLRTGLQDDVLMSPLKHAAERNSISDRERLIELAPPNSSDNPKDPHPTNRHQSAPGPLIYP